MPHMTNVYCAERAEAKLKSKHKNVKPLHAGSHVDL